MKLISFLSFIVLFLPTAAYAREIHLQQTNGPSAGAIKSGMGFSDSNPDVIYVDRYKSTDAGRTWQEFNLPTGDMVSNIAVDPRNPDIVFIASSNIIFKSVNGAKTWQELGPLGPPPNTPGWDSRSVSAMAVHPSQSGIIFAGTSHGNLYRSKDGGQHWSDISSILDVISSISRIKFNSQNEKEIYISTGSWYLNSTERQQIGNGLFKSSDGGETFTHLKNEFSSHLVHDVDVLGNTVYVVTRYAPFTDDDWRGVYRSQDSGKTWKKLLDSQSSSFPFGGIGLTHIAVNPSDEKNIIITVGSDTAGIAFALSYDGGDTWKPIITDQASVSYTHELEMLADGRVYAQDYYVPFLKSKDGGATWQWSSDGIRRSSITALQIHPNNRNVVFAGTVDGGFHKTYDGGKKWQRFFPGLLDGSYVATIEFQPRDSQRFYFGVSQGSDHTTGRFGESPHRDSGLYVTSDSGKTWSKATGLKHPKSPNQFDVYDILVHPDNPDIMLVGTGADGVYRSEDGGKTWQEANSGIPKEGFYWNFQFDDPGENKWEKECKHGTPQDKLSCFFYATRTSMHLYVNPHQRNEIWYTTLNGIFVSKDLGKSWQWLSDDLKQMHVHFMAFDPSDQNIIYVGTHQGGIGKDGKVIDSSKGLLISRDGGKIWSQIVDTDPDNDAPYGPGQGYDIRAIAVDPKNPNFVAVGTHPGFFISENKGKTWREVELGQEGAIQIDEIKIDSTAKAIYLGTVQLGVWRGILDYSDQYSALVEITGISAPKSAKSGEVFDIIVSVDNVGGKSGSLPVRLKIGEYEASKTVQVAAADQTSAGFSLNLKNTGTYEIIVNNFKYGEVDVVAEEIRERKTVTSPEIQNSETLQKSIQVSSSEVVHPPKRSFIELLLDMITSFFRKLLGR